MQPKKRFKKANK